MQLFDTLDAGTTARICSDGCLVADVRAARVGIQQYLGREVDPDNAHGLRDQAVVNVYRPEEEVFSRDSMASYAAAPFTIDHPSVAVTADNWSQYGKGEVNGDVVRDRDFVRVPIIVRDAASVAKVNTTHKQLSMGYECTLDFTPGQLADGTPYSAIQRNIRINHIAAVRAARGGPELKISDERSPPEKPAMKIKIGDAEVDATNGEAVRIAVDALNTRLTAQDTQIGKLTADVATATQALATKDGEVIALTKKVEDAAITPEKLQALVDARTAVVALAHSIAPALVVDGKTDADIRREAVAVKLGDAAKDMADAAIEGAFIAFTKDTKPAAQGAQSMGLPKTVTDASTAADAALVKSVNDLNAWRKQA